MIALKAGQASLAIDPRHGGRIASLEIDGLELLVARCDDPIGWGCYPMAPFAGRVRDGRFAFGGRSFQLECNLPPHAIHGTTLDAGWARSMPDASGGEPGAVAALEAPLGAGWPFAGRATSRFALSETGLVIDLVTHADEVPFPACIGWHPWFRRRLARGAEARLEFEAGAMYVRDSAGIPTGERVAPTLGPWDDCFNQISGPVCIEWPNALRLTLESTGDHFVIYDKPADALCVEPQTGPPDALNLAPRLVLPGEPLALRLELGWTLEGEAGSHAPIP